MTSTASHPTIVPDHDAPSGVFVRDGSRGVVLVREIRDAEPGSDKERELASRLEKLEDLHEAVVALGGVADAAKKIGQGGKWLAALLSTALLGSPVVERFVTPASQVETAVKEIKSELHEARRERAAIAAWLWDLEQCRKGDAPCPVQPPASVRMLQAADEMERETSL